MKFQELNNDQRRETVNTRQRYQAFLDAKRKASSYRGSMVWNAVKGRQYLVRSGYDKAGLRRQVSLGIRSEKTEQQKADYDRGRAEAEARLHDLKTVLDRQAAINRALGLGRVPLISARIVRALDSAGLLGASVRVVGTHALYAYEAAAGVLIDPGLTTTEDIDLLFDSRQRLTFAANHHLSDRSLLSILQRVDRSFEKTSQAYRASNRDGYLVDLIKPMRNPPWQSERETIGNDPADLNAIQTAGLAWHESAPAFESVAIDEKGQPVGIVTTDPRVWAAHKLWLSKQPDRDPIKCKRDDAQARAVASLVTQYMPHLRFSSDEFRMLPKDVVDEAAPLFLPSDLSD